MFKRTWIAAAVLALPLLLGHFGGALHAAPPQPWDWHPTDPGFSGLPDTDATSARFLVLSGPSNNGLVGDAAGRTTLVLTFPGLAAADPVRIALFDPNSVGLWDQRTDGRLLLTTPNVFYELWADPDGTVAGLLNDADPLNDPAPLFSRNALDHYNADTASDDDWCPYYDSTVGAHSTPQTAAFARTPAGQIRLVFRARLAPGDDFFEGPERAGFKVAFNGTYLLPANTQVGFGGGVIDLRTIVGAENQLTLNSFDPATALTPAGPGEDPRRWFDGTFNFHIHSSHACPGDLVTENADGDWHDPSDPNAQNASPLTPLENPTGLPPDNVGYYRRPNELAVPYRDVAALLILDPDAQGTPRPIRWSLFPVAGLGQHEGTGTPTNPPFSSLATSPGGRVSYDVGQEPGAWHATPLGAATILASPGLWCMRWESVDKGNFVGLRFSRDVGTTPRDPEVEGRLFCDADRDGELDPEADAPYPGPVSLTLQRVECAGGQPIGDPIAIQTDASGAWGPIAVAPGCYDLAPVGNLDFTPTGGVTFPVRVEVSGEECEPTSVDIGFDCTRSICGFVYCEDTGDCVFGEGDRPLPAGSNATVIVQRVDAQGQPIGDPILIPLEDGVARWCADGLELGTYEVIVDAPGLSPAATCEPVCERVLTAESGEQDPCNFGFDCECEVSGYVYCDDNRNGERDEGDRPVAGLTVEVRPAGQPAAPPLVDTTDADGFYSIVLTQGDWVVTLPFPQPPLTDGTVLVSAASVEFACEGSSVGPIDFRLECLSRLAGRVWCDVPCDGEFDPEVDIPVLGLTIELRKDDQVVATTTTGAGGLYEFTGLLPGTYTVSIPEGQPEVAGKAGPEPTQYIVTLPLARECEEGEDCPLEYSSEVTGLDFYYCQSRIAGRVWCEDPCDGIFQGDTDTPLGGITVVLETLLGAPVAQTQTAADGTYAFEPVAPGSYRVRTLPSALTADKVGPLPANYELTVPAEGELSTAYTNIDFVYCFHSLGGRVFCERQICDGVWDGARDQPLPGLTIELVRDGQVVATTQTAADGTYGFSPLGDGTYTVRIAAADAVQAGKFGPFPPSHTVALPAPGEVTSKFTNLDFSYCPAAQIYGKVWIDDCDGVLEPEELENGLAGFPVTLSQGGQVIAQTVTDFFGNYLFDGLDAGLYTVSVNGQDFADLDLSPSTALAVPVNLNVGDAAQVNFGACRLGRIFGYVFEDPLGNCDGVFGEGDTPLEGVRVTLTGTPLGAVELETFTDGNGFYEFTGLEAGDYTVTVHTPTPNVRNLTLATAGVVEVVLPAGGERRVDFGYCTQQVCGKVWREPSENCDGAFDPNGDTPLAGIWVEILGVAGAATGFASETQTNALGEYCFTEIPTGSYEIRVSGRVENEPLLVDLEPREPTLRTPAVQVGQVVPDQDFVYCEPCVQKLCVRVFSEPKDLCDGTFDGRIDSTLPWIRIVVTSVDDPDQAPTLGTTAEDGTVCFFDLVPGRYKVCIDPCQVIPGCEFERRCEWVTLEPCEDLEVLFPCCERCKPIPCCEGPLHEVVVQTVFWIGDQRDPAIDLKACLYADCDGGEVVDMASLSFQGDFPGKVAGPGGVLTVLDVLNRGDGTVAVLLRVEANGWFAEGHFGDCRRKLSVVFNGCENVGCARLRCEELWPGALFSWDEGHCGPRPACYTDERYGPTPEWWSECNAECQPLYFVLDTLSYEAWVACEGVPPCDPVVDPVCKTLKIPCAGKKEDGTPHVAWAGVSGDDGLLDEVGVEFTGTGWRGEATGENGLITIRKVWCEGEDWYVRVCIARTCGCPPAVGTLPEVGKLVAGVGDCQTCADVRLACPVPGGECQPVAAD